MLDFSKNPKVSVIIPVYNSENYLRECLDSIINQSLDEIEIICVNDGSKDNSLEILKEYSKKDDRIIILDEINQGAGFSRKIGIDISKGEYIYFADSDDILDTNLCELAYENGVNNDSDITFFKVNYFNTKTNYSYVPEKFDLSSFFPENVDFDNFTFDWKSIKPVVLNQFTNIWNCLFRGDFLRENNFYFPKNLSFNDVPLHVQSIIMASQMSFVPKVLYNYRLFNENSITSQSHNNNKIFDFFKIVNFLDNFFEDMDLSSTFRLDLIEFRLIQYNYHLSNLNNKLLSEKFFEEVKSELNSFNILDYELNNLSKDLETILNSFNESSNYLDFNLKMGYEQFDLKDIKVSVVIPVYNVEEYLESCLDCVVNQSLEDIEIICVNDGSTDNSLEILNKYSKKDNRIKIITQKNCGLGCARNTGLRYVSGEYVFFLDSDDKISLDALELLYNNAISNNSDLIIFKIARFDDDSVYYSNPGFPFDKFFSDVDFNNFTFSYNDIKNYVLNASFSAWSKLYRMEFLDSFDDFQFPVGTAYEDILFHVKCFLRAKKISFVPKFFYQYRLSNSSSIMHNKSNFYDIFNICNDVEKFLKNYNYINEFYLEFVRFKLTQLSQYILIVDSQKYYSLVQNEFKQLSFNKNYVAANLLEIYNDVLYFDSYNDYKMHVENRNNSSQLPISLILPITNEKYLFQCFDSILNQSFNNFEVICIVENLSSNLSSIIEYVLNDYRFKIYVKDFEDINSVRNFGLTHANGEFIYFINDDEWMVENTLENFYNLSVEKNLDMLLFPRIICDGSKYEYKLDNLPIFGENFDGKVFNPKNLSNLLFDLNIFYCNCFIKREIYIKSNFSFHENKMFSEISFFFKLFLTSDRIYLIHDNYFYKNNFINSTTEYKNGSLIDILFVFSDILKFFKEKQLLNFYKECLPNYIVKKALYYYNCIEISYKSTYYIEMKRFFYKIDSNNDFHELFSKNLAEDLLIHFENVLVTDNYREFDLMLKLYEKENEIKELNFELANLKKLIDGGV